LCTELMRSLAIEEERTEWGKKEADQREAGTTRGRYEKNEVGTKEETTNTSGCEESKCSGYRRSWVQRKYQIQESIKILK
jgi:hypothetical protein